MLLSHELPLVSTIAVGFSAAFICGLIAAKLRLSPIVGYLVAGILIGPSTPGFVADLHIAEQLSEVGIVLLMFGVGLHFSLRDLMEVKGIALPGAVAQIAVATSFGWAMASFWGWSMQSGIIFGLALSVASTVVLIRALEEHDLLESTNGNIAIGWLIVEDIVMVLALVLFPALAHIGQIESNAANIITELAWAIGKMVFFIAFMLVAGRRFLPWLLMTVARTRSRELFTVAVFAVAMGVAFAAAKLFGVSFALGAFFAGMMIRESDLSREAAEKALPLQDAFAVLFFVSVGMLFNPMVLMEKPLHVVSVIAVILIVKSLAATLIVLLCNYSLKTALVVSSGLAQIGEFSFVLAGLGVAYGLLPVEGRDLLLAGALFSISLNPALFHASKLICLYVSRHPRAARLFKLDHDDLAHLGEQARGDVKGRVILVGSGRVGKHISRNIQSAQINLVVVDANRDRVEGLREQGFHAIAGDATHAEVLLEAGIEDAIAIIVAIPNPYEARRIVETARVMNPDIRVLARAHNDEEMEYFAERGVDLAVMGPREVGARMVRYLQEELMTSRRDVM